MSMIKIHYPIRRRRDLSVSEFSHYWITMHAEFAKSFPQIQGMTQCVAVPDTPAGLGAPLAKTWCDGAAEMWLEGEAALEELAADPGFAALIADEDNFLEPGMRFFVKTSEWILDEEGFDRWRRGVKVAVFARRPEGTPREDFLRAWSQDDPTVGRALGATRQVECASVDPAADNDPTGDEAPYDAVRELWWPNLDAVQAAAESDPDGWAALIRPDAIDLERSFALCSHERVVLPYWDRTWQVDRAPAI
jgi:hypothetical protein